MWQIILIIAILLVGGYFILALFGIGMMGGKDVLYPIISIIALMSIFIYPLSSDLRENYKLTHAEKQHIDYSKLKSGQLLLINRRQYEFVKATDNKIVVKRNGELEVFRIKFTEVELIR